MFRDGAILFTGVCAGNWAAEKWLLKANEGDSGLVLVAPGFGLDDLTRATCVVLVVVALHFIVPGR